MDTPENTSQSPNADVVSPVRKLLEASNSLLNSDTIDYHFNPQSDAIWEQAKINGRLLLTKSGKPNDGTVPLPWFITYIRNVMPEEKTLEFNVAFKEMAKTGNIGGRRLSKLKVSKFFDHVTRTNCSNLSESIQELNPDDLDSTSSTNPNDSYNAFTANLQANANADHREQQDFETASCATSLTSGVGTLCHGESTATLMTPEFQDRHSQNLNFEMSTKGQVNYKNCNFDDDHELLSELVENNSFDEATSQQNLEIVRSTFEAKSPKRRSSQIPVNVKRKGSFANQRWKNVLLT